MITDDFDPLPTMGQSTMEDGSRWATGGAIVAGLTASLCCIGPLALAALGLGGAGLMARFEAIRPVMAIVTLALIGIGFYLSYRKPSLAQDAACACPEPRSRGVGRAGLWVGAVLALGMLTFPSWSSVVLLPSDTPLASQMSRADVETGTFSVEGMTCAGCFTAVEGAASAVDGVVLVNVGLDPGRATISWDPTRTSPAVIVSAINKTGYEASVPEDGLPPVLAHRPKGSTP